ncbi:MAG: hypothetical protein QOE75_2457 [Solirubrobacterales bacterium]|jgi:hypothetical protein|nr:hypothetical protein [Solirubrobacterales bacterium]
MKLAGVLMGTLLAAVVVASCGGTDGSDTTSSVTKAEFVKQASSICTKTAAKRDAAALALFKEQRKRGEPSAKELQKRMEEVVSEAVLPALDHMTDELAELDAPTDGQEQVDAMIDAYREAIQEAESELTAVANGDSDPLSQPRKLAIAYGVKACVQV